MMTVLPGLHRARRIRTIPSLAALGLAFLLMTGCAAQTLTPLDVSGVQRLTTAERFTVSPDGVHHGWWDGEQLPGQPTNLVIFSTKQQTVIQRIGTPPELTGANLETLKSGKWAADVMLVLDPARNRIMGSFTVDTKGRPSNDPVLQMTVAGYEGWWNSTPEDGNVAGLPNETVQINTRTNAVIDGFNRTTQGSNINYTVHPDPAWPKDSIIIVDTATNKVVDSFPVDETGQPLPD